MIALVDYGIGNLRSVEKALQAAGAQVCLTSDPEVILSAEKVVLPGVGAFGDGMAGLRERKLVEVIQALPNKGIPLLGICLGMQLLFEVGEEMGNYAGLGLIPGHVRHFPETGLKIPQTGWNQVSFSRDSLHRQGIPLLEGLEDNCYAYFNHSFYCDPSAASIVLAWTEYGIEYASVVGREHLYGVQFHPEKSQSVGLQLLRNFVEKC
jgi:imidazole glycerol-phosphate synthase subunit HisH